MSRRAFAAVLLVLAVLLGLATWWLAGAGPRPERVPEVAAPVVRRSAPPAAPSTIETGVPETPPAARTSAPLPSEPTAARTGADAPESDLDPEERMIRFRFLDAATGLEIDDVALEASLHSEQAYVYEASDYDPGEDRERGLVEVRLLRSVRFLEVTAQHPLFRPWHEVYTLPAPEREVALIEARLEPAGPPGTLEVEVTDAQGTPLEYAVVVEGPSGDQFVMSSERGPGPITREVVAGTYRVGLDPKSYDTSLLGWGVDRVAGTREVEVPAGGRGTARFALPIAATLTVRVPDVEVLWPVPANDPGDDPPVRLWLARQEAGDEVRLESLRPPDPDASWTFRIPAGTWKVGAIVPGGGSPAQTVSLRPGGEAEVTLQIARGQLVCAGIVTDAATGEPLEGAEVYPHMGKGDFSIPMVPFLGDRDTPAGRFGVRTDAQGRFELYGVAPPPAVGLFTMTHAERTVPVVAASALEMSIALEPLGVIELEVVDTAGAPVVERRFRIALSGEAPQEQLSGVTDEQGLARWFVAPGVYSIEVDQDGMAGPTRAGIRVAPRARTVLRLQVPALPR